MKHKDPNIPTCEFDTMLKDLRLIGAGPYDKETHNFRKMGEIHPDWYVRRGFAAKTKSWVAGELTEKGREFLAALESIKDSKSRDASFVLMTNGS